MTGTGPPTIGRDTAAAVLVAFARNALTNELPGPVLQQAKLHLLDTVGVGLAGRQSEPAVAARRVALAQGGAGQASVIGASERLPAASAALVNGTSCHALDFDDTDERSGTHVSAVVGPAALAVGEATGASGREVVAAYVAGVEAVARIGSACAEGIYARGFHPTSVVGVIGSTLAAAALMRLTQEQAVNALGLAGSFSSGLLEFLADGSGTKPLHAGWSAAAGVQAACLAAAGATGPASVLEGRFGVLATHGTGPGATDARLSASLADLGAAWRIGAVALKLYPACHFVHACVHQAARLADARPTGARISRIVVQIPDPGVPIVLEPSAAKLRPRTGYHARFSLPFCIGARLARGSLTLDSFRPDTLDDPAVHEIAARVSHEPWPSQPPASMFAGATRIVFDDGTEAAAPPAAPPGAASNPLSSDEVRGKFRALAGAKDDARVQRLEGILLGLEAEETLVPAGRSLADLSNGPAPGEPVPSAAGGRSDA